MLFYCIFYIFRFLPFKISLALKAFLVCVFALSFIIEMFCWINFKAFVNPIFIDTLLATNFNEASEFLGFYLGIKGVLLIFVFIALSVLFFKVRIPLKPLGRKTSFTLFIVCLLVWILEGKITRYLHENRLSPLSIYVNVESVFKEGSDFLTL
ncbi:MAG: phosphoethanolamine transferase domain-containing protein [Helicobacter sp.]|nr:phosphoethanolamine transferase domain-containing protein [Helicobacter sp.]